MLARSALLAAGLGLTAFAQSPPVATAQYLERDTALNTDLNSPLWSTAPKVTTAHGPLNEPAPGHETDIRLRWSERYLYVLFTCPYRGLYLKPDPVTRTETNRLWNWDVAEIFIGGDFDKIWQYREYQVSPQGEWVDLDIDRNSPKPEGGWGWNSGFQVAARRDEAAHVWYGALKIPFESIDQRPPKPGLEYRANFYRLQGPPPERVYVTWNPTGTKNYHVPEKFGLLRLVK